MSRPLCACHGEPMRPRSDVLGGSGWRCAVAANAAQARYRRTAKGLVAASRYAQTRHHPLSDILYRSQQEA